MTDIDPALICSYNNPMAITFDPAKRERTLSERGLDFADAGEVFAGGKEEVIEAGRRFAESERGKLRAADVEDKAEAKEKKREKKRKRKEREREVSFVSSGVGCL